MYGKTVLLPFGENQRYDLVIEDKGRFLKVQCKTGRLHGDVVEFNSCSYHYGKAKNYRGEVDLFGVWCEDFRDRVWLVPVGKVGKYNGFLRLGQPKNKQSKKINWAKKYELGIVSL